MALSDPSRDKDGNEIPRTGIDHILDRVGDITKGITDSPLIREAAGHCAHATNLVYNTASRLTPHQGWRLINKQGFTESFQVSDNRIDHLFSLDNEILLAIAGGQLFQYDAANDSFSVLFGGTVEWEDHDVYTSVEIDKEVYIGTGLYREIKRVYRDQAGEVQIESITIPTPDISSLGDDYPLETDTRLYRFFFERKKRVYDSSNPPDNGPPVNLGGRVVTDWGPYIQLREKSPLLSQTGVILSDNYPVYVPEDFNSQARAAKENMWDNMAAGFGEVIFLDQPIGSIAIPASLIYLGGVPAVEEEFEQFTPEVRHAEIQRRLSAGDTLEGGVYTVDVRNRYRSFIRNVIYTTNEGGGAHRSLGAAITVKAFSVLNPNNDPDLTDEENIVRAEVNVRPVDISQTNPRYHVPRRGTAPPRTWMDADFTQAAPEDLDDLVRNGQGSLLYDSAHYYPLEWGPSMLRNGILPVGRISAPEETSVMVELPDGTMETAIYRTWEIFTMERTTESGRVGLGQRVLISGEGSTSVGNSVVGYIGGVYRPGPLGGGVFPYQNPSYPYDGTLNFRSVSRPGGCLRITSDIEGRNPVDLSRVVGGSGTIRIAPYNENIVNFRGIAHNDESFTLRVFRTRRGQSDYFEVPSDKFAIGMLPTGVATYTDSSTDEEIAAGASFPAVPDIPAPVAKYVGVAKGRLFLGSVDEIPYRLRYSGGTVSSHFFNGDFLDFPFDIVAMQAFNNNMFVFTATSAHRVESVRGGGFSEFSIENISGAVSARSVIETPDFLLFASENGIFMTNGIKVVRISDHIRDRWNRVRKKETVHGFFDPVRERAYLWYVDNSDIRNGHDRAFVIDVRQTRGSGGGVFCEINEHEGPFENSNAVAMTAIAYHKGDIYRANGDRRMARYSDDAPGREAYLDEGIRDILIYPFFLSAGLHFGRIGARKIVSRVSIDVDMRAGAIDLFIIPDGGPEKITGDRIEYLKHDDSSQEHDDNLSRPHGNIENLSLRAHDFHSVQRSVNKRSHSFYQVGFTPAARTEHSIVATLPDTSILTPDSIGPLPVTITLPDGMDFNPIYPDRPRPFNFYFLVFDKSFPGIGRVFQDANFVVLDYPPTTSYQGNERELTIYVSGPFLLLRDVQKYPKTGCQVRPS